MKKIQALTVAVFATSAIIINQSSSQGQEPTSQDATVDPIIEVLKETCNVLKSHKMMSVEMEISYDDVLETGEKVQHNARQKLLVQKPGQLRADYEGDENNSQFYYDGKTFSVFVPEDNLYASSPAEPTLDQFVDSIQEKFGVVIPMTNLVVNDPCEELIPNIVSAEYEIGRASCRERV